VTESNVEKIYGLTSMQEGMLYRKILNKGSTEYIIQSVFEYKGALDIEIARSSLDLLSLKHEVLRTAFLVTEVKPLQVILRDRRIELIVRHVKDDVEIEEQKKSDVLRGFDLKNDSLMRVSALNKDNGESVILWTIHHIIVDGWSSALLFGDFFGFYEKLQKGIAYEEILDEIKEERSMSGSYQDYIHILERKDKEEGLRYWEKLLEGYSEVAEITPMHVGEAGGEPGGEVERETGGEAGGEAGGEVKHEAGGEAGNAIGGDAGGEVERLILQIDEEISNKLQFFARQEEITLNNIAEAAWGIVLQKYNRTGDVVFGKVVSGRNAPVKGIGGIVGLFINTVPIRVRSDRDTTIRSLIQSIHTQGVESAEFDHCPLVEIQGRSTLGRHLFSTVFAFENYYIDGRALAKSQELNLDIKMLDFREQTNYGLSLSSSYTNGRLNFSLMYDPRVYGKTEAEFILKRIGMVISDIAEYPDKTIGDVDVLAPAERRRILYEFNDTRAEYPHDKTINRLFEEQAEKTPNNIALVLNDESMTYSELNAKSNQLARLLREKGVKPDGIVGIMVERSLEMIVGIMGVLKSGGAYLPVDPGYPDDRIRFILEDGGVEILLTQSRLSGNTGFSGEKINLDEAGLYEGDATDLESTGGPGNLAYVIYTSGTTGMPKGVMVEHRGVVNLTVGQIKIFNIDERDRVLQFYSISFDGSMWIIYLALLSGATLYLVNENMLIDNYKFNSYMRDNRITFISAVPSFLEWLNLDEADSLKKIAAGGEVCPTSLAKRMSEKLEFYNAYGPTEATVVSTIYRVDSEKIGAKIPIGKPIENYQAYILDSGAQPAFLGLPGELCISGDGLARGYLNRPELTAEKFVSNPFIPGARMYRTGDLARWLPDGNIEFLGRIDHQVKIRGFRIELGEIESRLLEIGSVKETVVIDCGDETGDKYLCAYVVSDEEIPASELRLKISEYLPDYMIPRYFVFLEKLPLSPNGKVDRKALPAPELRSGTEYAAPRNAAEEELAYIWSEVLGRDKVGIHEDFFDLGGNSLKAIRFSYMANQKNINIDINDVFKHPTIAELAASIGKNDQAVPGRAGKDFDKYRVIFNANQIIKSAPRENSPGNVFITGATGFLGAHILDEYLKSEHGLAYCLVRGKTLQESKIRLHEALNFYFGDRYIGQDDRIVVVNGDLASRINCDCEIGLVIHSAAKVKHYGFYSDFYEANVQSVKNVIDFTKSKQAKMLHISTIGIISDIPVQIDDSGREIVFCENSPYITDKYENFYSRSKFEAEIAVLDSMLNGLKANIIRVGNLTNRYEDAKFQPNLQENAFLKRLKALIELGMISEDMLLQQFEMSPVDCTANAILKIARHFNERNNIFHVNNSKLVSVKSFLEALKRLHIRPQIFAGDVEGLLAKISDPQKKANYHEAFHSEENEIKKSKRDTAIVLDNTITTDYLDKIGFNWPVDHVGYLVKYIKYFIDIGFFNLPLTI